MTGPEIVDAVEAELATMAAEREGILLARAEIAIEIAVDGLPAAVRRRCDSALGDVENEDGSS